jgi:hypothetical protein
MTVRHPHERGALCLGLLDQPHERRVRALAGGTVRADIERSTRVRGAAEDRHPARRGLGQQFAAERARVDHGLGVHDRSVDRYDLARSHHDDIADLYLLNRHLIEPIPDPELSDLRSTLDQRRQLAPPATGGDRLKHNPASS